MAGLFCIIFFKQFAIIVLYSLYRLHLNLLTRLPGNKRYSYNLNEKNIYLP
jgi:hypothetical protein